MGMSSDGDDVRPGAGLWGRIERHLQAPRPPIVLEQYEWQEYAPRIKSHVLEANRARGYVRLLIWIEPDGPIPYHGHEADEDVFVLEGGLVLEGENQGTYLAGSTFRSTQGREHRGRAMPGRHCVCHVILYDRRPSES